jgi:hypothetical protein
VLTDGGRNMTDTVAAEVEDVVVGYLSARRRLLEVAERHPELLGGNDNIVGTRIGEYIAMCWLKRQGRNPVKVESPTEKGYDLLDGDTRISVKMLTQENIRGRTTRLTDPWDELLVIDFDTKALRYRVGRLLRIDFDRACIENPTWSRQPYVKLTMLGKKGLIGVFGHVSDPIDFQATESGQQQIVRADAIGDS